MDSEETKVVLVTGASAGIGAAVARELAAMGYDLVLTARRADRLEALARELIAASGSPRRRPIEVLTVAAALDDPATPERLVAETAARFGRLDALINNAGFGLPTLFADGDPVELRRQIEVNFVAPLLLARQALPMLVERRGTIVNIGSAITAVANSGLGAYGATKAGLAYWNDALRRELRHKGLRVCLVEPGPVKTEFFSALEKLAPEGGEYNPLLDAPAPWMSASLDTVARRIARLVERPKRRLSVTKRFVWPFRVVGGVFQVCPWLGDVALSSIARHFDRKGDLNRMRRRIGDARPTE